MSALSDLIDIELLLSARTQGMGAFNEVGGGLGGVAKAALAVGAVVATALGTAAVVSMDWAAQFQKDLTLIHTQAGDTSADLNKIGMDLEHLSTQVGYGPDELAKSLYHVESAGFRGAAALDMVRQAAQLAQVGGADLESTTQAVIGSLAAFGDRGLTAAQAVAILNATVGAGDMRMEGLAEAMSTGILPAARTVGLGLKDVGAAMATLTDNATPPEEAATRLRMTFTQLAAPTEAAQKALAKIGLSGTQLAEDMRKPNGLLVAIQDLKAHLDKSGMSATEQAQIIARAFGGGRSSAAIETLLSEFDRFKEKYGAITDGANNFQAAWAETQQTTSFEWQQMQADLQTLGTVAGAALLPLAGGILHSVLPALQQFANWMTGPGQKDLQALGNEAGKISGGFQTFFNELLQGKSPAQALGDSLKQMGVSAGTAGAAGKLFGDIMKTLGPIMNDAKKFVMDFYKEHKAAFEDIRKTTKQIMDELGPLIEAVLGAIRQFWHDHGAQVMRIVGGFMNLILGVIQDVMHIIADVIKLVTDIIKGNWHGAWQDVVQIIDDAFQLILDLIQNGISLWKNTLDFFLSWMLDLGKNIMEGLATGIGDGAHAVWNAIVNSVMSPVNHVKQLLGISSPSKIAHEMGDNFMQGWANGIVGGTGKLANAMRGAASVLTNGGPSAPTGSLVAAGGGGSIIFDFRGSQMMSDRDMDKLAQKLMPAIGRAAVGAGLKFRV